MKVVAMLALVLGASAGHTASLLVEPTIGYEQGKNTFSDGSAKENLKGAVFGARLGVQQMGLQFGLAYTTGSWKDDSTPQVTVTPEFAGIFLGYDFLVLLRIFAEYDVLAKQKFSVDSYNYRWDGGNGYKLGVGFKLLPLVNLNVEYRGGTYKKVNGTDYNTTMTNTMINANISIPFMY